MTVQHVYKAEIYTKPAIQAIINQTSIVTLFDVKNMPALIEVAEAVLLYYDGTDGSIYQMYNRVYRQETHLSPEQAVYVLNSIIHAHRTTR
jgi:hypothetical protein